MIGLLKKFGDLMEEAEKELDSGEFYRFMEEITDYLNEKMEEGTADDEI
ncbi:hypothetical protein [Acetobacterium wieringae]|nr:hypothetical protein [Acetobacterium wieringae]URN85853.1 hypothetical protein CHL1_001527 [Acetobacterium wieringae]